jgi:hypothetical protein
LQEGRTLAPDARGLTDDRPRSAYR